MGLADRAGLAAAARELSDSAAELQAAGVLYATDPAAAFNQLRAAVRDVGQASAKVLRFVAYLEDPDAA